MNENAKEYLSGIKGFAGVKRPAVLTEEELEVAGGSPWFLLPIWSPSLWEG